MDIKEIMSEKVVNKLNKLSCTIYYLDSHQVVLDRINSLPKFTGTDIAQIEEILDANIHSYESTGKTISLKFN
jgi:hypothetical protein